MSNYHKHQQQRYHHENTKIDMFINYMYVDVLFPLTQAITIMFQCVTIHNQALKTVMQCVVITSARYHTRYHRSYRTFFLSLTWVGHNALNYHNFNVLPREIPHLFTQFSIFGGLFATHTTRYRLFLKKNINIIFFINLKEKA